MGGPPGHAGPGPDRVLGTEHLAPPSGRCNRRGFKAQRFKALIGEHQTMRADGQATQAMRTRLLLTLLLVR